MSLSKKCLVKITLNVGKKSINVFKNHPINEILFHNRVAISSKVVSTLAQIVVSSFGLGEKAMEDMVRVIS